MTEKPKCYGCKWRANLPGDAHSCCQHPAAQQALNNPLGQVLAVFASVQRTEPVQGEPTALINVTGSQHGIRKGWFNWPWNFDPVWLETCDGFEARDDD